MEANRMWDKYGMNLTKEHDKWTSYHPLTNANVLLDNINALDHIFLGFWKAFEAIPNEKLVKTEKWWLEVELQGEQSTNYKEHHYRVSSEKNWRALGTGWVMWSFFSSWTKDLGTKK